MNYGRSARVNESKEKKGLGRHQELWPGRGNRREPQNRYEGRGDDLRKGKWARAKTHISPPDLAWMRPRFCDGLNMKARHRITGLEYLVSP